MADRYWICKTTGNWSDTANWSDTYDGSTGKSVPTIGDMAYFILQGHDLGEDYPVCIFDIDAACDGLGNAYSEGSTPITVYFNGRTTSFEIAGIDLSSEVIQLLDISDSTIIVSSWRLSDTIDKVTTGSTIELKAKVDLIEAKYNAYMEDQGEGSIYNNLRLNYNNIDGAIIAISQRYYDVAFNTISVVPNSDISVFFYTGNYTLVPDLILHCVSWEVTGSIGNNFHITVESIDYFRGGGT